MPDPTYRTTPSGVGIIADGAHVPADSANRDWQLKTALEQSDGIDPLPPLYLELAPAIAAAVKAVNAAALAYRSSLLPAGPGSDALFIWRHAEAIAADAEETPDPDDYPLLAAEVPHTAATVALVAEAVLDEAESVFDGWAAVEAVRAGTVAALEACANQAQIDAIVAAIDWPS